MPVVHFNQNDTKKFLDFLSNRKQKRVLLLAEIIRYNLSHMATPEGFNVIECSGRQSIKGIFRSVESISDHYNY